MTHRRENVLKADYAGIFDEFAHVLAVLELAETSFSPAKNKTITLE